MYPVQTVTYLSAGHWPQRWRPSCNADNWRNRRRQRPSPRHYTGRGRRQRGSANRSIGAANRIPGIVEAGAAPHCPAGHFSPYSDGEKEPAAARAPFLQG
ncbi:MAG: hypothetical protein EOQ92_27460 [Mesorhizobium sp.]|nr:MAG: hypothetical protein EOQ92_27460 [Mesorhizobium sp.]